MKLLHLLLAEIAYRKSNFLLGSLSIAVALGTIVGGTGMLRTYDWRTEQLVEAKEAATRKEMARMEDDYRKIMKRMGYNVMVLPKEQDFNELRQQGYGTATMPYEYAEKLAKGGLATLNHLLPVLQRKFVWPEHNLTVLLCGTDGQMALPGRGGRAPIQAPIPAGRVALGNALAQRLNVVAGEEITLMGNKYIVERVDSARGSLEDMAVWADLKQVQEWLKEPGSISGILALECVCHADSLGEIVAEVHKTLPDVQVYEFTSKVQGRAEARERAAEASRLAIAAEQAQRLKLREERVRLVTTISVLATGGAVLWILFLTYGNARDRRSEIGMLRALGMQQQKIMALLLGKALLMGVVGGLLGVVVGSLYASQNAEADLKWGQLWQLAGGWRLPFYLTAGPVMAALATWWPAFKAVRSDPAEVLGRE